MRITALQRDEVLRQKFICDASVYSSDMLVFLDETGADRRNTSRKYGYSIRGKCPVSQQLLVRGQRVSAMAVISTNGLLDVKIIKDTSNGDTFYEFLHSHVLPHLMPFDGQNPQCRYHGQLQHSPRRRDSNNDSRGWLLGPLSTTLLSGL